MNIFLIDNIAYHISNIVTIVLFSLLYTILNLKFFKLNRFFLKEYLRNFFAMIIIYVLYLVFMYLNENM